MNKENGLTLADLLQHAELSNLDPSTIYLLAADGNPIVSVDDEMPDLWFLGDEDI